MKKDAKVFLSYAHENQDFAERLATDLRKTGIEKVWIDRWELKAGDSIIEKIFSEGLANTDYFLILLSEASNNSIWVKEELNAAIIKKMEGLTRVIPIIIEKTDIPLSLRSLMWIDMSYDYDKALRGLIKTIYNVSEKPPVGKIPEYITSLEKSVGGLSKTASTVGILLISRPDDQTGFEKSYSAKKIHSLVPNFTSEELNDAIDELEEYGLVKTINFLGTAPYDFGQVTPTYALFLHFKEFISDHDPEEDIKQVANAVVAKKEISGDELQSILKMPPIRLNRAVSYLDDYGYVKVLKHLGTAPYNFGRVIAIRQTRKFVEEII